MIDSLYSRANIVYTRKQLDPWALPTEFTPKLCYSGEFRSEIQFWPFLVDAPEAESGWSAASWINMQNRNPIFYITALEANGSKNEPLKYPSPMRPPDWFSCACVGTPMQRPLLNHGTRSYMYVWMCVCVKKRDASNRICYLPQPGRYPRHSWTPSSPEWIRLLWLFKRETRVFSFFFLLRSFLKVSRRIGSAAGPNFNPKRPGLCAVFLDVPSTKIYIGHIKCHRRGNFITHKSNWNVRFSGVATNKD